MPLGNDRQFGLSWSEQDLIKRRLEIKQRLKMEGVRKRYDPFLMMKGEALMDPAVDRYMDLRKKGRMPGAPIAPKLYFPLMGIVLLPMIAIAYAIEWERRDWLIACANGDVPYEKRIGKNII